ncbi:lantibiotic dehydratase [Saccharothrix sp. Mg75]|uniref:lantibiotic dehydratase n=1 Tax=Saccharothrix sp. Mg75 TaxID=3445357 RepID=UPI003EE8D906
MGDPTAATHVRIGDDWALWRPFLLRAPGFPASGVAALAAPDLAAAADRATTPVDRAAYRERFAEAMSTLTLRLQEVTGTAGFRRALVWQNHRAAEGGLGSFLRRDPVADGRNARYRQQEERMANYWQRYCVKNDTIGFFGPVGWGRCDPSTPTSAVTNGPALVERSEIFFESWAVDRLAALIGTDERVRRWMPPYRRAFAEVGGTEVRLPGLRPLTLSASDAAVLARCDGTTPAHRIAGELAGTAPGLATEDDVYAMLDRLCRKRVLTWRLEVPAGLRPEVALRALLARIGDGTLRDAVEIGLDRLEAARDTVREAQDDPDKLALALVGLDEVFREVTGSEPGRNHGKMYGGRTLVFLDALRAATPVMGQDFLTALSPVELLLRSVRWYTHRIGQALAERMRDLVHQYTAEHGSAPTLAWLWSTAMPLVHDEGRVLADAVDAEFRLRWRTVLGEPADTPSLAYRGADLAGPVAEVFAAPKAGWTAARYCSPDVMVSAADDEAFRRGDFTLVLGEFHIAVNTLRNAVGVAFHPERDELFACLDAEDPRPRLHPVLPKESGRLSARTRPALIRDRDFLVALFDQTEDPARPGLLRAADLVVGSDADGVHVTVEGQRFDVLDVFAEMLMNLVGDRFDIFGDVPHTPRLTVDRLVVTRESWAFPATALGFAAVRDEADRYARTRHWWRDHGLPRHVFAKVQGQQKPIYVDFDSPLLVNVLCRAIRSADLTGDRTVRLTEMAPGADHLWLRDAAGRRYTSELRLATVDLGGHP